MVDISIIIPVYNVEKYLDRCMKSVISQSYKNIEIILVDDGSTDRSSVICDNYSREDSRIKVIHKINEGLGFARNSALEIAQGKYILFIDSDDYIDSKMIEKMLKRIENEQADVCYSDFYRVNKDTIIKNDHIRDLEGVYVDNDIRKIIIPNLIGSLPENKYDDVLGWGVWKVIYKREILEKYNIRFHSEREFISEDIIFQLDYLKYVKKAIIMKDAFYYYCINNGSLSKSYRKDRFERNKILYLEECKKVKELNIYEECLYRLQRLFLASIRMEIMIDVNLLTYKEFKKTFKSITNDEEVRTILKNFPINKLPFKQKIYNYLLKYNCCLGISLLTKYYIKYKNY